MFTNEKSWCGRGRRDSRKAGVAGSPHVSVRCTGDLASVVSPAEVGLALGEGFDAVVVAEVAVSRDTAIAGDDRGPGPVMLKWLHGGCGFVICDLPYSREVQMRHVVQ